MAATRIYRVQMLAMLSTLGQRPRFDQPLTSREPQVSLHPFSDAMNVRADSSEAALRKLDDAAALRYTANRARRIYDSARQLPILKPGDVIAIDGQPEWQDQTDGFSLIAPQTRPQVAGLIDSRSWNDVLCPLDATVDRGRQLRGLVALDLTHADVHAIRHALDDSGHQASARFVTRQHMAIIRRSGFARDRVTVRLTHGHVNDASRALLEAASREEHRWDHPSLASPLGADLLRETLRRVQNQAVAQTLDPPAPSAPAEVDLSW